MTRGSVLTPASVLTSVWALVGPVTAVTGPPELDRGWRSGYVTSQCYPPVAIVKRRRPQVRSDHRSADAARCQPPPEGWSGQLGRWCGEHQCIPNGWPGRVIERLTTQYGGERFRLRTMSQEKRAEDAGKISLTMPCKQQAPILSAPASLLLPK